MNFFDENPDMGAVTTCNVLSGAPVLMVSHDEDDGGWQFLCGTSSDPADGRIVHLASILAADPTLHELWDLPPGWIAFREVVGGQWTREPL